jgi:acyl-CoA synthetase (AMP-forming)/AMP-acid ligase II
MTGQLVAAGLAGAVDGWAAREPRRVALRSRGRDTTYAALSAASRALADDLARSGVQRGDRVAVHADPSPGAVVALLAVLRLRAVWLGLNPRYSARELEAVLETAGAQVLLACSPDAPAVVSAASAAGAIRLALTAEGGARPAASPSAVAVAGARPAPVPNGTAALVYTSGSTDEPRAAAIGGAALRGACAAAAAQWADCIGSVICDLPINHIGFLGDLVGTALVAGSTVILEPRFDPVRTCELLVTERVTAWTGVPAMFAATMAVLPDDADLSALRRVLYGGAPMPDAVLSALRSRTPVPVTGLYGSTETVANVAVAEQGRDSGARLPAASLGRAVAPYALRVVQLDGQAAEPGAAGQIQVRTPFAFTGYLGAPEASARAWTDDGWLRTGDLGTLEADGTVTYKGRADDLFKTGGYFVNPAEVEEQLLALPGVLDAVVTGVSDEQRGQVPAAMVVAPGAEPGTMRDLLRERLAGYKVPRTVVVVEALPLLPLGKTDRAAVTRTLQAHADRGAR